LYLLAKPPSLWGKTTPFRSDLTESGGVQRATAGKRENEARTCQQARKSKSLGGYQVHQGASGATWSLVVPAQRVLSSLLQVRLRLGYR
jgi:hypothetical protein